MRSQCSVESGSVATSLTMGSECLLLSSALMLSASLLSDLRFVSGFWPYALILGVGYVCLAPNGDEFNLKEVSELSQTPKTVVFSPF